VIGVQFVHNGELFAIEAHDAFSPSLTSYRRGGEGWLSGSHDGPIKEEKRLEEPSCW
jgi:hypothetical protein